MEDYELFLEHAASPRNVGALEEPDGVGAGVNPICGDTLRLMLRVGDGRVLAARFQAQGCAAAVAAASATTELIAGRPLAEIADLSPEAVAEALGGLPPGKVHGPALALDCLRQAIQDYHRRRASGPPEARRSAAPEPSPGRVASPRRVASGDFGDGRAP